MAETIDGDPAGADTSRTAADPRPGAATSWWRDAVGYEVYLRSFQDGDGDGIGDLGGLITRLDHLADLGVDILWVTPFFPSPMADFGYDVADYRGVDPRFGDLDTLDRLVEGVHERGMRLVIDIVPNHTSDQHPWFLRSRSSRDDEFRDRYLWRDPASDGGPPNNWVSHFGGPAWTFDEATGQYYCHLFLPEQPDLNWRNADVRAEFRDIISFWLDRGIDGFRIDVAHSLTKDPAFRDNPVPEPVPADAPPRAVFRAMEHRHDLDQHDNLEVYEQWRELTAPFDAALVGEVYLLDGESVGRYVGDGPLDFSFFFPVLHTTWDAGQLRRAIDEVLTHGAGCFAWVHSSHDDPRAATRFGGGEAGRTRAMAAIALTSMLPGPIFLYQGDELGLEDGEVDPNHRADPVATRNADPSDGRDPVRTPMPWDPDEPNMGFSRGRPWLPVAANHTAALSAAAQAEDDTSYLHAMRELLRVRRALLPLPDQTEWLDLGRDVLAIRRGPVVVAVNAGSGAVTSRALDGADLAFAHGGATHDDGVLTLPPDAVAVVRT